MRGCSDSTVENWTQRGSNRGAGRTVTGAHRSEKWVFYDRRSPACFITSYPFSSPYCRSLEVDRQEYITAARCSARPWGCSMSDKAWWYASAAPSTSHRCVRRGATLPTGSVRAREGQEEHNFGDGLPSALPCGLPSKSPATPSACRQSPWSRFAETAEKWRQIRERSSPPDADGTMHASILTTKKDPYVGGPTQRRAREDGQVKNGVSSGKIGADLG
jgi:hypothetical protein